MRWVKIIFLHLVILYKHGKSWSKLSSPSTSFQYQMSQSINCSNSSSVGFFVLVFLQESMMPCMQLANLFNKSWKNS